MLVEVSKDSKNGKAHRQQETSNEGLRQGGEQRMSG